MKKDWAAYLLAAGAVFGFAGLHRFYLGRPVSGVFYLVTWGWFGLGTLHDLIRMRALIARANNELTGGRAVHLHIHGNADPEAVSLAAAKSAALLAPPAPRTAEEIQAEREGVILRCARDKGGTVTTALVALEASLSLKQAQKELHRLRDAGFCTMDVSEEGAETFTFHGLGPTTPLKT
jgi:TM2 domain-containing membrane protein YozV